MRIIKKSTCSLITPTAQGKLTYNIGHEAADDNYHLRITHNSGGGFFSNEWISIEGVLTCIEEAPEDKPFRALIFRNLYQSRGANNHGFLAAALRAEGLLLPVKKATYSHQPGDPKVFFAAMKKLVASKVDLEDEVAKAQAEITAKRAQLAAKMKKAGKAKAASAPASENETEASEPVDETPKKKPSRRAPRKAPAKSSTPPAK
ncbi:hypothetical protein G8764_16750 [Pseudomaricurvus alcaniphilus]|uniref:hypothetical protein n=1 Tax=Pseudomaricurvus alcaniphilus TaxID=1166482 RepID=UPI001407966B|nr:hypothetical protein [Pseudomaricurvus alcaniphilus]NHN38960.1 hypothetical protein [Pseudomaricurvus alcaniphilus]